MSKSVKIEAYIDERVQSVRGARELGENAAKTLSDIKSRIWSLVTATPKDITPQGEEPLIYLKELFEEEWEGIWEAVRDDYVYNLVADDAEYNPESEVVKAWEKEKREQEELRAETEARRKWFAKYNLNEYNFDSYTIYNYYKDLGTQPSEPFTDETRKVLIDEINENSRRNLESLLKKVQEEKEDE